MNVLRHMDAVGTQKGWGGWAETTLSPERNGFGSAYETRRGLWAWWGLSLRRKGMPGPRTSLQTEESGQDFEGQGYEGPSRLLP